MYWTNDLWIDGTDIQWKWHWHNRRGKERSVKDRSGGYGWTTTLSVRRGNRQVYSYEQGVY